MERLTLWEVLTGDKLDTTDNIGGSEGGGSVLPDGQDAQVILHPGNQICHNKCPVSHWNHSEKDQDIDKNQCLNAERGF